MDQNIPCGGNRVQKGPHLFCYTVVLNIRRVPTCMYVIYIVLNTSELH